MARRRLVFTHGIDGRFGIGAFLRHRACPPGDQRFGGILGREIEVIVYDPGSIPETYRKMADKLLTEDGASVIFGCSTSAERKAVLPAIERRNGLLWYPSLYEGFEYSPNIIYTGAAPNQNSFPLAEYIVRKHGPHATPKARP